MKLESFLAGKKLGVLRNVFRNGIFRRQVQPIEKGIGPNC
jgi:hypothetical protein